MLKRSMRNVFVWLLFIPIFYTLMGFIVLPWWARSELPIRLHDSLGINLSINNVRFNPYSFELTVDGLALMDTNKSVVAKIENLYVNYNPTALFQKEFLIESIRIQKPFIDSSLDGQGHLKLLQLFSKTSSDSNASSTTNPFIMPLVIEDIELIEGVVHFADERLPKGFSVDIGPIAYSGHHVSFYRDDLSVHALQALIENEEKLSIVSSMSLDPLKLHGEIDIKKLPLAPLWGYFIPQMPAKLTSAQMSMHIPFWIDLSKEYPAMAFDKSSLLLEEIAFEDDQHHKLITIPAIKSDKIDFDLQSLHLNLDTLLIEKPSVSLTFENEYAPNLARLFTLPSTKSAPARTNNAKPFTYMLKNIRLEEGSLTLMDTNAKESSPLNVHLGHLSLGNITSDEKLAISYSLKALLNNKSSLDINGSLTPHTGTIQSQVMLKEFALNTIQPYIAPYTTLHIEDGLLSTNATLSGTMTAPQSLKIEADATINQLSLLDAFNQTMIAWDKLSLETIGYNVTPDLLSIAKIDFFKPYVNLDIKKNKQTNFSGIIKPMNASSNTQASKPLSVLIGAISLKEGTAHFKDASLPIPFATFIHQLNGKLSTIDTHSTKPSSIKMEGKVEKYGYTKVDGTLLPFDFKNHSSIKVLFKNINMPSLTPYSGKFVGYTIKEGKLSLDLNYQIKKGLLDGQNRINLDSLVLGEKIQSEDAVDLPLELAIALLKDSQGQIDLNLPISGDLNDPNFEYGSIIWKAFGNIVSGILTSPFKLLGAILGIETQTLHSIDFAPADTTIIASEEEKMVQYKSILEKRSGLKLLITPNYNTELDTKALKMATITTQIEQLLPPKNSNEDTYAKAVKTLYIQKYSSDAYTKVLKSLKEEKVDTASVNERLIAQMVDGVTISEDALKGLAQKRAETITQMLMTKYRVPKEKIIVQDASEGDAIREAWVGCAITLSN